MYIRVNDTPFVSCLCPTYNRYPTNRHLLEEAVESFLQQDYPAELRELIILNDTPGQELICNAPGVKVHNSPTRYNSLGEKRNALVAMSQGKILLPWDDDDISLPIRISQAVFYMKVVNTLTIKPDKPIYWNPYHYWYWEGSRLVYPNTIGYGHNCCAYTRDLKVEYFHTSGNEDAMFAQQVGKLNHRGTIDVTNGQFCVHPLEFPYIYRWNVSPHHLSGRADTNRHYKDIGSRAIMGGTFEIFPRWTMDYRELVTAAVKAYHDNLPNMHLKKVIREHKV